MNASLLAAMSAAIGLQPSFRYYHHAPQTPPGGTPPRTPSKRQKYRQPQGYGSQERKRNHVHPRHLRLSLEGSKQ